MKDKEGKTVFLTKEYIMALEALTGTKELKQGDKKLFLATESGEFSNATALSSVARGVQNPQKFNILNRQMKKKSVIMLLMLISSIQAQPVNVNLIVRDSINQGLESATCTFTKQGDSRVSAMGWTNEKGHLSVQLNKKGRYILNVSFLGTLLKELPFDLETEDGDIDLGVITVPSKAIMLGGVVVKGKHILRTPNSIKVNLRGTSLENIGTLLDVLREIPRITIQDESINVFGKGVPTVILDGRRVQNMDEVTQIKSSDIKNVEVLTNPPGKYGVNISSAVVITTSPPKSERAGFDIIDKMGMRGRLINTLNASGYLNLKKIELRYGVNHTSGGDKFHKEDSYEYNIPSGYTHNHLTADLNSDKNNINLSADLKYHFNEKQTLSLHSTLSPKNKEHTLVDGVFRHRVIGKLGRNEKQSLTNITDINKKSILWGGTYSFDTESTKVNLSTTYFNAEQESFREINYDDRKEIEVFKEHNDSHLFSFQGDAARKLTRSLEVLTGGEFTFTSREGNYTTQTNLSDLFKQKQLTGYLAMSYSISDNWNMNVQMGFEYIDFKYYTNGVISTGQSRHSFEWLPKIAVSYDNNTVAFELTYRKSTEKPTYNQLSSNNFMSNKYLRWDGNPTLQNSHSHLFSADFTYSWMSLSLSYGRISNGFFEVNTLIDKTKAIIMTSPQNLPGYNQFFAGVSINPRIGNWGILADAGVQIQDLEYNGNLYNKPLVAYTLRFDYTLPKGWGIRSGVSGHIEGGSYATGKTMGYANWDFRFSKSWMGGNLIAQLYANDILSTGYENIYLHTNGIVRQDFSHGGTRGLFFSLQYKWGNKPKAGKDRAVIREVSRLQSSY